MSPNSSLGIPLTLVLALTQGSALPAQQEKSDLVVRHARIWTGIPGLESAEPTALAVRGERLIAVGSEAEIAPLIGPTTRVIDAAGRRLLPGFIDSHTHFFAGGASLLAADLRLAASREEFVRRFAEHAARVPAGRWITNVTWDHERWPGSPLPTREWIDAAAGDHPVFISRLDGHMALANSRALALAGITRDSKDPSGGTIVRDAATGEPTGVLKEDPAMDLVFRVVPRPSPDELREFLDAAMAEAARYAVSFGASLRQLAGVADVSEWPVYGAARPPASSPSASPSARRSRSGTSATRPRRARAAPATPGCALGGLKGLRRRLARLLDRALLRTLFRRAGNLGPLGRRHVPRGRHGAARAAADAAGLQVSIHAIGEQRQCPILDIYERVARANGRATAVTASSTPSTCAPPTSRASPVWAWWHRCSRSTTPTTAAGPRSGSDPSAPATATCFRSLLDAGATPRLRHRLADRALDPMLGVAAAVTRRTLDGKNPGGWHPEQKITVAEALAAYTAGSAYAEFAEGDKGTLAPGKLADFVLMSDDPFAVAPGELETVHSALTVVGGRIVFDLAGSR